jgi:hypothetical protein
MFKKLLINLLYQVSSLVIVILIIGGAIWAYAAFTEPAAAPSASNQDFAQNILGADNNNNSFTSTNVSGNADGSIIERVENLLSEVLYIQNRGVGTTDVGGVTGSITGSVPEMIDYLWDNKASFGAGSSAPTGWTCTRRQVYGTSPQRVLCEGNEKVITGGCGSNSTALTSNGPGPGYLAPDTSATSTQGWYCAAGDALVAWANCCL